MLFCPKMNSAAGNLQRLSVKPITKFCVGYANTAQRQMLIVV